MNISINTVIFLKIDQSCYKMYIDFVIKLMYQGKGYLGESTNSEFL
jgi:hypothetical protein